MVEIPDVIVEELHTCLICEGETKEVSVHIEGRTCYDRKWKEIIVIPNIYKLMPVSISQPILPIRDGTSASRGSKEPALDITTPVAFMTR